MRKTLCCQTCAATSQTTPVTQTVTATTTTDSGDKRQAFKISPPAKNSKATDRIENLDKTKSHSVCRTFRCKCHVRWRSSCLLVGISRPPTTSEVVDDVTTESVSRADQKPTNQCNTLRCSCLRQWSSACRQIGIQKPTVAAKPVVTGVAVSVTPGTTRQPPRHHLSTRAPTVHGVSRRPATPLGTKPHTQSCTSVICVCMRTWTEACVRYGIPQPTTNKQEQPKQEQSACGSFRCRCHRRWRSACLRIGISRPEVRRG